MLGENNLELCLLFQYINYLYLTDRSAKISSTVTYNLLMPSRENKNSPHSRSEEEITESHITLTVLGASLGPNPFLR